MPKNDVAEMKSAQYDDGNRHAGPVHTVKNNGLETNDYNVTMAILSIRVV